jgi:hypothetical protein
MAACLKGLAIDRHYISQTIKISPYPDGIRGMLGMKEMKGFQILQAQLRADLNPDSAPK